MAKRDYVAALAKGLLVIEAFTPGTTRMSISDIAGKIGVTRAAARRYLLTLTTAGYTEFDGKYFRLTPHVLRLGIGYISSIPLTQIAQPIIDDVGEETNEAVALAILDGTDSLVIASFVPRRIVGVFTRIGTLLPLVSSSTGRILLSSQTDEVAHAIIKKSRPIRRNTPKTKTSIAAIIEEVTRIRVQGYALNDEEIEPGLRVIAVPVHNLSGKVVAALCISTHSGRFEIGQLKRNFLHILQRASAQLGLRMQ